MNEKSEFHHIYYRDGIHQDLSAATHVAIGAHPDDLEIMAGSIIESCLRDDQKRFVGIVCTHGVGDSILSNGASHEILRRVEVRRQEQLAAAQFGNYFAMIQLGHSSGEVKDPHFVLLGSQLGELIKTLEPDCLVTHNPFDRHDTHRAVFRNVHQALMQEKIVPKEYLGCEVWRGLDWLDSSLKKTLEIKDPQWIKQLISHFKSQNVGGRDFGQGLINRIQANCTFHDANFVSEVDQFIYALDLLPTLHLDPKQSLSSYLHGLIEPLRLEISKDFEF